jgi:hypothetical protein
VTHQHLRKSRRLQRRGQTVTKHSGAFVVVQTNKLPWLLIVLGDHGNKTLEDVDELAHVEVVVKLDSRRKKFGGDPI